MKGQRDFERVATPDWTAPDPLLTTEERLEMVELEKRELVRTWRWMARHSEADALSRRGELAGEMRRLVERLQTEALPAGKPGALDETAHEIAMVAAEAAILARVATAEGGFVDAAPREIGRLLNEAQLAQEEARNR